MSASDLFSQQLLSVTAYCWKKTIFVSQCSYHHLVILTMLTTSAFANPLNVNVVLRWLLLQLPMLSVINWIKWRWGEEILFSSEGGFYITRMSLCPPVTARIFPYWLFTDSHMQVNYSVWTMDDSGNCGVVRCIWYDMRTGQPPLIFPSNVWLHHHAYRLHCSVPIGLLSGSS